MTIIEIYNAFIHLKQTGTRWSRWKNTEAFSDTPTYVYNLCIQKCYVPVAFKQSKVIPLFKSGKSSDPSNYRPISVLSALSKSFEKHINIFLHILTKTACGLLHHNQSGFRENHSCHTALTSLADQWFSSINDNTFCGAFLWTMICSFKNWQCIDCLRRRLRHFLHTESKLCM